MSNIDPVIRRKTITDQISLLEHSYPEPVRRIAVASLKGRLFEMQGNGRFWLNSIFVRYRAMISFKLLRWIPDLIIAGYLPGRIGRHLVTDTLIMWSEQ